MIWDMAQGYGCGAIAAADICFGAHRTLSILVVSNREGPFSTLPGDTARARPQELLPANPHILLQVSPLQVSNMRQELFDPDRPQVRCVTPSALSRTSPLLFWVLPFSQNIWDCLLADGKRDSFEAGIQFLAEAPDSMAWSCCHPQEQHGNLAWVMVGADAGNKFKICCPSKWSKCTAIRMLSNLGFNLVPAARGSGRF